MCWRVQVRGGKRVRVLVHRRLHRPLQEYAELNGLVTSLGSVRDGELPRTVAHAARTRYPHARPQLRFPVEELQAMVSDSDSEETGGEGVLKHASLMCFAMHSSMLFPHDVSAR